MTDRLPSLVFIYLSGPQARGPSGESKTVEGVLQLLTQSDRIALGREDDTIERIGNEEDRQTLLDTLRHLSDDELLPVARAFSQFLNLANVAEMFHTTSRKNDEFHSPDELDKLFAKEAVKRNMKGLKGHRSLGGIRASIYNAMPIEGVQALVDAMKEFEKKIAK